MTEFAWVIERNDGGGGTPEYWTGKSIESFWTDPNEAIRFARREDALTVMHWILSDKGRAFCRAVEHGWETNQPLQNEPPMKRWS